MKAAHIKPLFDGPGSPDDLPRQHDHEAREEEIPEDTFNHHRVLAEPHRVQPVGGPARQRREAEVEALPKVFDKRILSKYI
jgi:hypothetical protein